MPYVVTNTYGGYAIDGDHGIICNSGTKTFRHNDMVATVTDYSPYNLHHIVYVVSGSASYDYTGTQKAGGVWIGRGWDHGWTDFSATVVSSGTVVRAFLLVDTVSSSGVEGIYKLSIGDAADSGLLDRSLIYNFDMAHFVSDTGTYREGSEIYVSRNMRHLIPVNSLVSNRSGAVIFRISDAYTPLQRGHFSSTVKHAELHIFYLPNSEAMSHSIDRYPGIVADNRIIRYTIDIDPSSISSTATELFPIDNKLTQDLFSSTFFTDRCHVGNHYASQDGLRYRYVWCRDYHTLVWRIKFRFGQNNYISENDFLMDSNYGSTTIGNLFSRDSYDLVGLISDTMDWSGTRHLNYSGSIVSGAFRTHIDIIDTKDNTTNYYFVTENIKTYAVYKIYDAYSISGAWYSGQTWINSGSRELVESYVPNFYREYGIV